MSIELKQVAEKSLDLRTPTLREMVTRHAAVIDSRATLEDMPEALAFQIDMARALLREFAAIQQAEAQQPATPEPVEDGIRNADDELNCAEEVLDAITCEFSDSEFPVTDFSCIGDYITAVVNAFKERLAAQAKKEGA